MNSRNMQFRVAIASTLLMASALCIRLVAAEGPSPETAETPPGTPSIVGQEQLEAMRSSLVGAWSAEIGRVRETIQFEEDGRFEMGNEQGQSTIVGTTLLLRSGDDEVAYDFALEDNKLVLSGGDLAWPVEFRKVRRLGESGSWLFDWSLPALKARLRRIAAIVVIVVLVQVILRSLRALAHFVIYSERGPLKSLYRRHKNRTMTIYSLVLNVSKYIIYLLAIGLILTELGIDYTVYLASLSVIGLAIGFGSQGLVQDMVTGFFIVFEEQFNVGDMVEVPPHTGIVEELGLRMTRLRNYTGQRVVIPNRNIGAVGNYIHGAQQVYIDVALAEGADAATATDVVTRAAEETARQFHDIVFSPPASEGQITLSTEERFLRLHLSIWPQQQWVIDRELLPRIHRLMKAQGMEVPSDRISVFYHPRESRLVSTRRRKQDTEGAAS